MRRPRARLGQAGSGCRADSATAAKEAASANSAVRGPAMATTTPASAGPAAAPTVKPMLSRAFPSRSSPCGAEHGRRRGAGQSAARDREGAGERREQRSRVAGRNRWRASRGREGRALHDVQRGQADAGVERLEAGDQRRRRQSPARTGGPGTGPRSQSGFRSDRRPAPPARSLPASRPVRRRSGPGQAAEGGQAKGAQGGGHGDANASQRRGGKYKFGSLRVVLCNGAVRIHGRERYPWVTAVAKQYRKKSPCSLTGCGVGDLRRAVTESRRFQIGSRRPALVPAVAYSWIRRSSASSVSKSASSPWR